LTVRAATAPRGSEVVLLLKELLSDNRPKGFAAADVESS
jgi:hypothetical protein